jgi:phytoene desaturase
MQRKLERSEWSMSLFVLYFGTDRAYDIAHHTVLFGPRYKGLLDEIFHGHHLPEDFSLYLHAPTVTDPSLAPEGCGTFYVLSPVPHLGNAKLDWESIAPVYADKILAYLERTMPDLRQHVVTRRWMTPVDFHDTLHAYHGSAFSLAPTLRQSAWFRPHNRDPKIPGLYIAGSGTHPGAGVPGVVNSAKATAGLVLADLGVGAR